MDAAKRTISARVPRRGLTVGRGVWKTSSPRFPAWTIRANSTGTNHYSLNARNVAGIRAGLRVFFRRWPVVAELRRLTGQVILIELDRVAAVH